jgi:hypothetical protein
MKGIRKFMLRNCKPFMKWYYFNTNKSDVISCLDLIDTHRREGNDETPIDYVITGLTEKLGWSRERSIKSVVICAYCGFISNN